MASDVDLCNLALQRIGAQDFITDLADTSSNGLACARVYPTVRDTLLRRFWWRFATKYDALAVPAGVTPPDIWTYAYRYPSDCLNARYILNPNDRANRAPIPFEVVSDGAGGRLIYTDYAEATLVYTVALTNAAAFDPMFFDALAWNVAMELALVLTEDQRVRRETATLFQASLAEAASTSFAEGQWDRNQAGDFQRARTV
jgi:hypothetical protein